MDSPLLSEKIERFKHKKSSLVGKFDLKYFTMNGYFCIVKKLEILMFTWFCLFFLQNSITMVSIYCTDLSLLCSGKTEKRTNLRKCYLIIIHPVCISYSEMWRRRCKLACSQLYQCPFIVIYFRSYFPTKEDFLFVTLSIFSISK